MAIQVSDKNRREMSPDRDFPQKVSVQKRYCILSSPRSGSTLLGRMLYETGQAGDPQEYFNPPLLMIERKTTGRTDLTLNEFLRRMESRRTSPNGMFGMKLHYSQMLGAFRARKPTQPMVGLLRKFNALIWIRRRDRIGQAISQAIAMHTQVWSSEDAKFGQNEKDVTAHPIECLRTLQMIAGDDFGWEHVLRASGLPVLEIWYEDLVADYEPQSRRVLRHLGLDSLVQTIPPPPLERQAGELNQRLRREVIEYLGLAGDLP